jgi:hypothetical protein
VTVRVDSHSNIVADRSGTVVDYDNMHYWLKLILKSNGMHTYIPLTLYSSQIFLRDVLRFTKITKLGRICPVVGVLWLMMMMNKYQYIEDFDKQTTTENTHSNTNSQ